MRINIYSQELLLEQGLEDAAINNGWSNSELAAAIADVADFARRCGIDPIEAEIID